MLNKVQLITYADSLVNGIGNLHNLLNKEFKGLFGGVHLLPIYPSSADRGFSPLTHLEIDPKFGTETELKNLAKDYELTLDLILNHISKDSIYFKDYLEKGNESEYKEIFNIPESLGVNLENYTEKLKKIYRPRPTSPIQEIQLNNGQTSLVWCSFSPEQIDINWQTPATKNLIYSYVQKIASYGAKLVRLDGFGYMYKKVDSFSFMIPETFELLHEIHMWITNLGMESLPEVHYNPQAQIQVAQIANYSYDFCLPILVLDAIFQADNSYLIKWLKDCPRNQITTLDCHDGLPVPDVDGYIEAKRLNSTLKILQKNGGNALLRASGINSDNLDIYQVNCTYYSALNENDEAYLLARAIQFFTPGIPQVYYDGLLFGKNDLELLEKTNHGRDVMRHYYNLNEIHQKMELTGVKTLFRLIKWRNQAEVFKESLTTASYEINILNQAEAELKWFGVNSSAKLHFNLKTLKFQIYENDNLINLHANT